MRYKNIVFDRAIGVELVLPATIAAGVVTPFQDVPQLRGAFVQGIEAFTDEQVASTPTQTSVFEAAAADDMLMTFVQGQEDYTQWIPYYTLISSKNGGLIREFKNLQVNINKSNVLIGGTAATGAKALYFMFYYSYKPVAY